MHNKNIFRLAIFFFIAFFIVAFNLKDASVIQNDSNVSEFIIGHQIEWLNVVSAILSVMFEPIYVVLFIFLLSVLLWIKKRKNEALYFIFVSGLSGASIYLLKHLFVRARPVTQFLAETGYSFPSGHTLISVVLFGSLLYFSLKVKNQLYKFSLVSLSLLGIIILGLSRVYLNVHWFSDILGGYFLGATILFLGIGLYKSNIFQKLANQIYPK